MIVKLRSWWQKIKQHPVRAILVIVGSALGIALIMVVVLGYWLNWHWTGIVPEMSEPKQHAKTLWDWLNLLGVLAIPAVVAIGAAWYTAQQGKVSEREKTDNQREDALQAYIDKISDLLLHERLSELLLDEHLAESHSPREIQVVIIARARTATVLRILDQGRRASLIRFLSQAGILTKCLEDELVGIDLSGVDLSRANLSKAKLWHANLSGANLSYANLTESRLDSANLSRANLFGAHLYQANLCWANLVGANLRGAYLVGADLVGADLSRANLEDAIYIQTETLDKQAEQLEKQAASLTGATMPDGKIHS